MAARELAHWYTRAAAIPDPVIRADALAALCEKRDNVEGASLFALLPKARSTHALRLLVAYQVMWDFLDSTTERSACAGSDTGRQLHLALIEALDPARAISDYYLHHPWKDDGGYLVSLVSTCRDACTALPAYSQTYPLIRRGVEQCAIQALNHDSDPRRREEALRALVDRGDVSKDPTLTWFEQAAAISAFTPHVLLALAADETYRDAELGAVCAAYFPWVPLVIAMLDSYLDREHDAASGAHSYISYYPNETLALRRIAELIERVSSSAASLPDSHRHAVLLEGIVAWHLSAKGAIEPSARAQTKVLAAAGGPLMRWLIPMARVWRTVRADLSRLKPALGDESPKDAPNLPSVSRARGAHSLPSIGRAQDVHCLPPGLPLPAFALTYAYWRWPFAYMRLCQTRYRACFTHRMSSFPLLVFLSDPADVRAMLTAPPDVLHPGEGGAKIEPIVGDRSFMLLDGDRHMTVRQSILPTFARRTIGDEPDWIETTARRAVRSWPQDVALALHPRLRSLTLEVVLRRIFAWSGPDHEARLRALRDRVLAMLEITDSATFPLPLLRHGPGRAVWRRFLRDRDATDELIARIVADRLQTERGPPAGSSVRDVPADALKALIQACHPDGTAMAAQDLRDNVMSLVLAGHETTASQLAWAFQLLAHNPRVQQRLIEELDMGVGDRYLTATVQEVLRHRPVFMFSIPRAVKRPIEIGGWNHRPPVHLLGCIYLLHHDPTAYSEPEEFRPERFLEDRPDPNWWMPWGGGRKRCPGSYLAMLEMKTVLRTVLERMTVHPASPRMERPRWRSVIVTPHAGGRVILRTREQPRIVSRRLNRTMADASGGAGGSISRDEQEAGAGTAIVQDADPRQIAARESGAYDRCPAHIRQALDGPIKSNTDFSQNI